MDEFSGYKFSWNGFIDYIRCYHEVKKGWVISGTIIWMGTLISLTPQLIKIIKKRSSHGISPLFAILTSIGHFLFTNNYFCLHNADFAGITQINSSRTIPRFLTFVNLFSLWICYLPVLVMLTIFFDFRKRRNRDILTIMNEWKIVRIFFFVYVGVLFIVFTVVLLIGSYNGYSSDVVLNTGKLSGGVSSIISIIHYIPQFYKTFQLKDHGSLSLTMLSIQAPGGLTNAMIMMIGQGEHWTTFLPILLSSIQQFILLGMCLYYKYSKKAESSTLLPAELVPYTPEL